MPTPSVAVVDDTCRAACKAMKLQSKQLLMLSSSYAKLPFRNSGDEILQVLSATMESIQNVQESLSKAAIAMRQELGNSTKIEEFPETILVTAKEYALLNAVFQEYTNNISSRDYSLFCSASDICSEARQSCLDNVKKSNDS